MVLPVFAFVLGSVVFGILGAVVLRLSSVAPVRPLTLAAFVGAAFAATLVYAAIYGRLFGHDGELKSRAAVIFFLIGSLVVATVAGAITAKAVSQVVRRSHSNV